jgi:hypothetical protein
MNRNEVMYNSDVDHNNRLEQEVLAQVRKLYESSEQLAANDRELFTVPLADMLSHPWQSLQTWLTTAKDTVKTCLNAYTERLLAQQPLINSVLRSNSFNSNSIDNTNPHNHLSPNNTHGQESLSPRRR